MGARVAKRGLLAHQALRLHDPGRGRVTIDGDDIAAVSLSSLRQRVSLVPQEKAHISPHLPTPPHISP